MTAPINYALLYARRSWPVFPLFGVTENGCECRRSACAEDRSKWGKHPRTMSGFKDATVDEQQIREWWSMWPNSNVGVATGGGLVAVDVDPRHGGEETIERLAEERTFPRAPTVATGGGGLHFYFAGDLARGGIDALGPGVDVKATGGYVVMPPSLHGSGQRYAWLVFDAEPEPLPDWLTPIERPRYTPEPGTPATPHGTNYALGALRSEFEQARTRRDGQRRRNGLYEAGLKLSRFRLSDELAYDDIVRALAAAGVESGLPADEATAHVTNGLDQGIRNGVSA